MRLLLLAFFKLRLESVDQNRLLTFRSETRPYNPVLYSENYKIERLNNDLYVLKAVF